jgi:hypothetical protein
MAHNQSSQLLAEMKLFASLSAAEQRYVRRSLDVGLNRRDALAQWARSPDEATAIMAQARRYKVLNVIRACLPDEDEAIEPFLGLLVSVTAADLSDGKIGCFDAYCFLYERLIGPEVRPWLVSAFSAAASLPVIHPERRKELLQSISIQHATAAGWSIRPPLFFPEWVEKVPEAVS